MFGPLSLPPRYLGGYGSWNRRNGPAKMNLKPRRGGTCMQMSLLWRFGFSRLGLHTGSSPLGLNGGRSVTDPLGSEHALKFVAVEVTRL